MGVKINITHHKKKMDDYTAFFRINQESFQFFNSFAVKMLQVGAVYYGHDKMYQADSILTILC